MVVATPGHGLPAARAVLRSALEVRREGGVDVALVEGPDQQRRHEPAVLAHLVDHVVARAREEDVLVDAGRLVGLAHAGEEVLVGLRLPAAEARAGPGARRAALLAVDAVVEPELLLEVERLVRARRVLVADDVVRAGDHAAGAPGAEPGGDDLVVELLPLERPALLLPRRQGVRARGRVVRDGHGRSVRRSNEPTWLSPATGGSHVGTGDNGRMRPLGREGPP